MVLSADLFEERKSRAKIQVGSLDCTCELKSDITHTQYMLNKIIDRAHNSNMWEGKGRPAWATEWDYITVLGIDWSSGTFFFLCLWLPKKWFSKINFGELSALWCSKKFPQEDQIKRLISKAVHSHATQESYVVGESTPKLTDQFYTNHDSHWALSNNK